METTGPELTFSPLPTGATDPAIIAPPPPNKMKVMMRRLGWGSFTVFCLLFFTFLKIPDVRIKNYVQGSLAASLADSGISFSSMSSSVSIGFGITYKMKDVKLMFRDSPETVSINEVSFSPSLLPMILGRFGGTLNAYQGRSRLWISFSVQPSATAPITRLSFEAKEVDIGKAGILESLGHVQGSGLISGEGDLKGNFDNPSTLEGSVDLKLAKIVVDQQNIMGFAIPRIQISQGEINATFAKSKAILNKVSLGKSGNIEDDLKGSITGDMSLGQRWDASTLNLKARFNLSEKVLQAFAILDAILNGFKQPDGSFSLLLTGPLTAPIPTNGGAS